MHCANGSWLPGAMFMHFFKDYEHAVRFFQIRQERRGEFVLKIVKNRRFTQVEFDDMMKALRRFVGDDTKIDVEFCETIPLLKTGKRSPVVSTVPRRLPVFVATDRADRRRVSAGRENRFVAYATRTAGWIPASVIGLLMLPMVVTSRSFGPDFTVHLWALRQQQWNIEAMGHPGLFVSVRPLGAFYPVFAFTGSGIYSVGGYLAILLGPIVAYKLLILTGLCLAYGGFTWLAVQFGLRGWRSQIPGAVFVTGAYFITDMVGRGDFAEFIALASVPFVIAAISAYLKGSRAGLRHRLAVVFGVFVLSGSHNITLLWGATFVVLLAVLGVVGWASTWRRPLPWRRVAQLVGLGAIGGGLNAWYLFPDVAYGFDTLVGLVSKITRPGTIFVHPALLLNPLRPADRSPTIVHFFARDIRLSFPCLIFAWAIVVVMLQWRKNGWVARRLFLGLLVLTVAFVILVMNTQPWSWLPRIYWNTQFTWRLDGYVLAGHDLAHDARALVAGGVTGIGSPLDDRHVGRRGPVQPRCRGVAGMASAVRVRDRGVRGADPRSLRRDSCRGALCDAAQLVRGR